MSARAAYRMLDWGANGEYLQDNGRGLRMAIGALLTALNNHAVLFARERSNEGYIPSTGYAI